MKKVITISLLCLVGCRTVKTSQKASEEMKKHLELSTVAVEAGTRESNVLTYWPDGSVYQFEQVKEQMDQARMGKLNVEERRVDSQSETMKEREPMKFWLYAGIGLALVVALVVAIRT